MKDVHLSQGSLQCCLVGIAIELDTQSGLNSESLINASLTVKQFAIVSGSRVPLVIASLSTRSCFVNPSMPMVCIAWSVFSRIYPHFLHVYSTDSTNDPRSSLFSACYAQSMHLRTEWVPMDSEC